MTAVTARTRPFEPAHQAQIKRRSRFLLQLVTAGMLKLVHIANHDKLDSIDSKLSIMLEKDYFTIFIAR